MAINLGEKIIPDGAVLRALEACGWCHIDGVPHADDEASAQAIIDAYTLDDYKAHRKRESMRTAKELRDRIVADRSAGEMASWPVKLKEVTAYGATSDPSDAPLLAAEAAARGVPLQEIIDRVQSNAAIFSAAEAAISGADGAHRDAISALSTWPAVRDYDLTTGWPSL